jgi:hypothetical protein
VGIGTNSEQSGHVRFAIGLDVWLVYPRLKHDFIGHF